MSQNDKTTTTLTSCTDDGKKCWSSNNKNNSTKPIFIVFLFVIFRFAFQQMNGKKACYTPQITLLIQFLVLLLLIVLCARDMYICCLFQHFSLEKFFFFKDWCCCGIFSKLWLFSSITFACLFILLCPKFRGFRFVCVCAK